MMKSILFFTLVVLLFSAAGCFVLFTTVNPLTMTIEQTVLFYTVLWLALSSASTLLLAWLNKVRSPRAYLRLLRMAMLASGAVVVLLLLQAYRLLTWANALPLLAAVVLLEFFFRSSDRLPGKWQE